MGQPKPIRLGADSAQLVGVSVATSRTGYSGSTKGYLTGFRNAEDHARFKVVVPTAGIYGLRIRYCSPSGTKAYDLDVNGTKVSGLFEGTGETFAMHSAGKVELRQGENVLTIGKGWGWFDIDYIELTAVGRARGPRKPPATLVDPSATAKTRALMSSLVQSYGRATLSGVYSLEDAEHVRKTAGALPAVLGGDLMDYSPSRVARGAKPDGTVENLIEQARRGYIVTLSWHWNAPKDLIDKTFVNERGRKVEAPWWRGFYSEATTFDVQKALADEQSEDYRLLLSDIDQIAQQLRKFADADVPVLWRPLHEAEGRWFWWGAKGPDPFVKLWRLMYDRLSNHHGLHNLIWVYTGTANPQWYPGDGYVDIIGIDSYPHNLHDPLSSLWESLQERFAGKKLLAISEFGGVPDVPRMQRFGAFWAYFVSWTGREGPRKVASAELQRIYRDKGVQNRTGTQGPG